MLRREKIRTVDPCPIKLWTPWWYRPSHFLMGITLPTLLIFAFSDYALTLSKARLFYSHRDTALGVFVVLTLALASWIAERDETQQFLRSVLNALRRTGGQRRTNSFQVKHGGRIAECLLFEKVDWVLMAIFIVSHLIFFRHFFTNPGLVPEVLGGNLELKKTFETIPGVTTWTQVTMLLGAIRGFRWAGVLPGNIKLISLFHIIFFGTLLMRAILWSERLALIEGAIPFILCALPKIALLAGRLGRLALQFVPFIMPLLVFFIFTGFEFFRSWQSNIGEHANILTFGWRRLFTYYFEAMNTGAAHLYPAGFYDHFTFPMSGAKYESIFTGLYQAGILDIEFNNTSGIWYLCARVGNILLLPALLALGFFLGSSYRCFVNGRLFGLIYPVNFLLLMELIRIYYWPLTTRVLPTTLVLLVILAWSFSLGKRIKIMTIPERRSLPVEP